MWSRLRGQLAVKERARGERRSAGAVLSDLARQALTHPYRAEEAGEAEDFCGFKPLPHRGEAVSNALIDRLREDDVA